MQGRELNGVTRNNTACIENLLQGRLSSCTSRLKEKMFRMTNAAGWCPRIIRTTWRTARMAIQLNTVPMERGFWKSKVFFLHYIMQMTCKVTWDSGHLSTESLNSALTPPPPPTTLIPHIEVRFK